MSKAAERFALFTPFGKLNVSIAINKGRVLMVQDSPVGGTEIVLNEGTRVHVAETYSEVLYLLSK